MSFLFLILVFFAVFHLRFLQDVAFLSNRKDKAAVAMGAAFVITGVMHFSNPDRFLPMMPPWLPWHMGLIYLSGALEIAGGSALAVRSTRRVAALDQHDDGRGQAGEVLEAAARAGPRPFPGARHGPGAAAPAEAVVAVPVDDLDRAPGKPPGLLVERPPEAAQAVEGHALRRRGPGRQLDRETDLPLEDTYLVR